MTDEEFSISAGSAPHGPDQLHLLTRPSNYYKGINPPAAHVPQNILVFARSKHDPCTQYPVSHHRFLLLIAWGGAVEMLVDGEHFRLPPGHSLLILPYQFHYYRLVKGEDAEWLMITFEGPEPSHYFGLRNQPIPTTMETNNWANEVVSLWLARENANSARIQRLSYLVGLMIASMLDAILSQGERRPDMTHGAHEDLILRVARHVVDHSSGPMRIAELATIFAISSSHLRNRFREAMGISLGDFIRRSRIQRACKSLIQTDLSCSQIADRFGFSSLYVFSRAFKAEFGVSPSAYRKRAQLG